MEADQTARTTVGNVNPMYRKLAVLITVLFLAASCSGSEQAAPADPAPSTTTPPTTTTTVSGTDEDEVVRVIPSEPVVVVTTAVPEPGRDTKFFETLPEPYYDPQFVIQDTPSDGLWEIPTDPDEIAELEAEIAARYELAMLMLNADIEAYHADEESPFRFNLPNAVTEPFAGRYARNKLSGLSSITEYQDREIYADNHQVHVRMLPDLWPWAVAELWVCQATNTTVRNAETREVVNGGDREIGLVARMRYIDGDWKFMGYVQNTDSVPHLEEDGCWNHVPDPYY